jgi:hypothetical protein
MGGISFVCNELVIFINIEIFCCIIMIIPPCKWFYMNVVCLLFYLSSYIHGFLKYVVSCMLNHGLASPWFILYVWSVFYFVLEGGYIIVWYQSSRFNNKLVWAKSQCELGKLIL